jgi:serine phosphatase RsbU (regulator of sigma subunit)
MGTTGTLVRIPEQDDRLRDIQNMTQVALSRPEERDFLWELLDRTKKILGADSAAVLLLDRRSGELVAASAVGQDDEEVHQRVRLPLSQRLAELIAAECRPVAMDDVDHSKVLNPILLTTEVRSVLGVPLMDGGTVVGLLHVGSQTRREFTDADAELLQLAADRAAQITQVEYSPAAGLQRSMLPPALPEIPGLELAARYVPGHGKIGGDWYDVFVLPTGEPCAVIGDVAGSGLQAAVIMDRLRTAVRSYALETRDPADVLARLDHHVQHFEPDVIATVLCAVFLPGLDKAEISSAGHFPPVIAAPGHPPELADIASDQLIGVSPVERRATTIAVPPGTTLCLYTDGLVERRGRDLDEGQEMLRRAVTTGPPRANCDAVMQDLVGHDKSDDDIAILMMRRALLDRPGERVRRSQVGIRRNQLAGVTIPYSWILR